MKHQARAILNVKGLNSRGTFPGRDHKGADVTDFSYSHEIGGRQGTNGTGMLKMSWNTEGSRLVSRWVDSKTI